MGATEADRYTEELLAQDESRDLLNDVHEFLCRYIVFSSEDDARAVTLWVCHTWLLDNFDTTPRLVIRSVEKQSGKTTLLELLEMVVKDGALALSMTVSTVFRLIDAIQPTILQDEVDTIFGPKAKKDNEELRGVYNGGYKRGAKIWRTVNFTEPTAYDVFGAVAFAGIDDEGVAPLPDTILDRAVVVHLRRKTRDEKVAVPRLREVKPWAKWISDRLEKWAAASAPSRLDVPAMPEGPSYRQTDVWEPLVAIADLADLEWADGARQAFLALTAAQAADDADSSAQLRLLRDLREVFGPDEDRVATDLLIARLCVLDESPWAAFEFGQPTLDALKMSRLLKGYGVRPERWAVGADRKAVRGYFRRDLEDAWARYLSPGESGVSPG